MVVYGAAAKRILFPFLLYAPLSPSRISTAGGRGGVWYAGITLSACPSVQVYPDDISCAAQPFLSKLGMVVYYHEAICHAEKLVHYL